MRIPGYLVLFIPRLPCPARDADAVARGQNPQPPIYWCAPGLGIQPHMGTSEKLALNLAPGVPFAAPSLEMSYVSRSESRSGGVQPSALPGDWGPPRT